jgi:chromosome segregation ATPase
VNIRRKVMQDILNPKVFELQKINNHIAQCAEALVQVEEKINYLDMLCIPETQELKDLSQNKEKLSQELKALEEEKEKINDELVDSAEIKEIIKIKYALLLSSYAAHHDNPTSKPKKEVQSLMQKILNFKKS